MFAESVTALMIASLLSAQAPAPAAPIAPTPAQNQSVVAPRNVPAPAPASQTVTIPTGTAIQLTLMSSVRSKSTQAGDTVRAVVAFPVTIGTQLAIPAGTFVDGDVIRVTARAKPGQQPSFRAHFTRLIFSNGYSVALNGENTQALALPLGSSAPNSEVADLAPIRLAGKTFAMGEGQIGEPPPTEPPTLPRVGPNPAVIGGAIGGGFAALLVVFAVMAHHRANSTDFVLYDSGWQFQVVLDSPVTLDEAQVSAAAAAPSAN
jgi:hypothetical protein